MSSTPPKRPQVALGFLGTTLDVGKADRRWNRWRPTVGLGALEGMSLDRIELLADHKHLDLAAVVAADLRHVSPDIDVRIHETKIKDPWDFEEIYALLYDFTRRYAFKPDEEDYFLHITTGSHVMQICSFLLCESKIVPARLLQTAPKRGAEAHRALAQVIDLDLSRYDNIASRFAQRAEEGAERLKQGIATRSERFNALIDEIEIVASTSKDPILLTGPTGVGKTSLAKRLFQLKRARGLVANAAPFIEVNCATVRGDLAMSTLFGHVRGAFTGAVKDGTGLLELADGGVLFLDEVGELGLDEQAMLLRAIEDKTFRPMGSTKERHSDFQLICGTNRELGREVARGAFREDLLARVDLWEFCLPSLRERLADLEPNLDFELDLYERRTKKRVRFNAEARARFLAFAISEDAVWSGNFRELSAAVTRMATLGRATGRITVEIAAKEIAKLEAAWAKRREKPALSAVAVAPAPSLPTDLCLYDRLVLSAVLDVCRSSRSLAEAGRKLFGEAAAANATDRVRKLLLRHGIDPQGVLAKARG